MRIPRVAMATRPERDAEFGVKNPVAGTELPLDFILDFGEIQVTTTLSFPGSPGHRPALQGGFCVTGGR